VGMVLGVTGMAIYQSGVLPNHAFAKTDIRVIKPDQNGSNTAPGTQTPSSNPFAWTNTGNHWFDDDWFSGPSAQGNWDPFQEIEQMQQHMDRMFDNMLNRFSSNRGTIGLGTTPALSTPFAPSLDLQDEGERYVVKFDLPGADKSNVKVQVNGQILTISGKREETVEQKDNHGNLIRQERKAGAFERSLTLPGPVDSNGVQAKYDNGVLTVTLPKAKSSSGGNQIEVK